MYTSDLLSIGEIWQYFEQEKEETTSTEHDNSKYLVSKKLLQGKIIWEEVNG